MINTKKGFTIVELIVTIFIITIISSISYISVNTISEFDIRNKSLFISDFFKRNINEVIKNVKNDVYIFVSSSGSFNKNKYLFSYVKTNNCENLNLTDIYSYYVVDGEYAYFTGNLLSNLTWIDLFKSEDSKVFFSISGSTNYEHNISDSSEFKYTLYGTGEFIDYNESKKKVVKCGDIYVFFMGKYTISNIIVNNFQNQYFYDQIVLKFTSQNMKGELFKFQDIDSKRIFFKEIILQIKNENNLSFSFDPLKNIDN